MFGATITAEHGIPVRLLGVVAVLLGQFLLVLDATVVHAALPAMQRDLALSPGELAWITSAYVIGFGGFLLVFARLADQLGHRRIFLVGIAAFTLASVACGLAPDAPRLILARFIQGIGAAALSSMILASIATMLPRPADRAKAIGGYVFASISGCVLGLVIGSLVARALGWEWTFWLDVPLGVLALSVVERHVRTAGAGARTRARVPIDVSGAVLVTGATMLAIYAVVEAGHRSWTASAVRIASASAIVLGVLFFVVESQRRHPLVPLRVLPPRSLVVIGVIGGLILVGLYSVGFAERWIV